LRKTSNESQRIKSAKENTGNSKDTSGDQRPQSMISKDFRIPLKRQKHTRYKHRDRLPRRVLTSPKLGEKRRNDDLFDEGQRYKKLVFQRRLDGWYAPPRPFEMSHPRLSRQQYEWFDLMPRR